MDIYGQIAQAVRKLSGNDNIKSTIFTAEVTEVTGQTCSVKIGDLLVTDVRLRSVINDETDMLLITPKIGSQVLIVDISGGNCRSLVVIEYSEIEKINLKIGETTLEVDNSIIKLNGGTNEGLVQINKLTSELNGLVQTVNSLISSYNSHIHVTSATVGATPVVGTITATPSTAQTASEFDKSDFENIKVKH